jgi:hypothetical protein
VVYCLAFNNPFGDRVATGSFDKTAKVTKNLIRQINLKIMKIFLKK